jgi:hypothetical protein
MHNSTYIRTVVRANLCIIASTACQIKPPRNVLSSSPQFRRPLLRRASPTSAIGPQQRPPKKWCSNVFLIRRRRLPLGQPNLVWVRVGIRIARQRHGSVVGVTTTTSLPEPLCAASLWSSPDAPAAVAVTYVPHLPLPSHHARRLRRRQQPQ